MAALAYAAGAAVVVQLVRAALDEPSTTAADVASSPPSDTTARLDDAGRDALATRALAARVQGSVFVVETPGGGVGSGFVGWVERGRSYVVTARPVVAGVLVEDGRTAFVRRGGRVWIGRIVAADRRNALALIRVDTELADPLWQRPRDVGLELGARAVIVPAGPDAGLGEGEAAASNDGRSGIRAPVQRLNLGAPVVTAGGRLASVVVGTEPDGFHRTVPVDRICELIRRCT